MMEMELPTSDAAATPPLCGGSLKATACEMKWQATAGFEIQDVFGDECARGPSEGIGANISLAACKALALLAPETLLPRELLSTATDLTARLEPLLSRINSCSDRAAPKRAARST